MSEFAIDILGYVAMGIVGISFLMKKVNTLRLLNIFGCLLFIIWGIIIKEPPVYILNTFIVLVNFYYLVIIKKGKNIPNQ